MTLEKVGLHLPEILLPKSNVDLNKWAVIACDQYTSQPDYWNAVESHTAGHASTLNLIFPEVYLEEDGEDRIQTINQTMQRYMEDEILVPQKPGFILVERSLPHGKKRKGLVVALDLEMYDYNKGAQTLIRATEGTILDRLPPRIKVRENAVLELPHIMVLLDDPDKTVIEPLFDQDPELLYDFDLMMDSGNIKGYKIDSPTQIDSVAQSLEKLIDPDLFQKKYGVEEQAVMLFAMGDGNHSFATAKAIWEDLKSKADDPADVMDHPARYALVELVNVHDEGIEFEPIHRVVFNIEVKAMLGAMQQFFEADGSSFAHQVFDTRSEMETASQQAFEGHQIAFSAGDQWGLLQIKNPTSNLEVGNLQAFLNHYENEQPAIKIDYIHGADVVEELGKQANNIGFYLPVMSKQDLFKTTIVDGALPRKTFSMGEAEEKRFYLETRRIQATS